MAHVVRISHLLAQELQLGHAVLFDVADLWDKMASNFTLQTTSHHWRNVCELRNQYQGYQRGSSIKVSMPETNRIR